MDRAVCMQVSESPDGIAKAWEDVTGVFTSHKLVEQRWSESKNPQQLSDQLFSSVQLPTFPNSKKKQTSKRFSCIFLSLSEAFRTNFPLLLPSFSNYS